MGLHIRPPKAATRTECAKCGQFYSRGVSTTIIGPCAGSSYDDRRAGWRDPAHAWATTVDPSADAKAPNRASPEDVAPALRLARGGFESAATLAERLTAEHVEASSALVALGQADDGRTLAERIGDAHAEVMRHLHAARADIARLTREKAALEAERDAEKDAPTPREMSEAACRHRTVGQGYQNGFEAGVMAERARLEVGFGPIAQSVAERIKREIARWPGEYSAQFIARELGLSVERVRQVVALAGIRKVK